MGRLEPNTNPTTEPKSTATVKADAARAKHAARVHEDGREARAAAQRGGRELGVPLAQRVEGRRQLGIVDAVARERRERDGRELVEQRAKVGAELRVVAEDLAINSRDRLINSRDLSGHK